MRSGVGRFSRRTAILSVLLSVFIVVMIAGGMVLSAIGEVSHHANQLDDDRSRQTTAGALKTFLAQLGATLNDYAAWDDAAANAYSNDGMAWMNSNFGEMSENSALFDVALVVDPQRNAILAYRDGKPMTVPAGQFFDTSLWRLLDEAAASSEAPEARGFVRTRKGIAAAGVALIRPKSGVLDQPADKRRFLVFARHLDDRIEPEHIPVLRVRPQCEPRNHRRASTIRDSRERGVRARCNAEEIDERAFLGGRVLIDQHPHGFVLRKGTQNRASSVFLPDNVIARHPAALFYVLVDSWIIQRSNDHVHRLRHERVGERA